MILFLSCQSNSEDKNVLEGQSTKKSSYEEDMDLVKEVLYDLNTEEADSMLNTIE